MKKNKNIGLIGLIIVTLFGCNNNSNSSSNNATSTSSTNSMNISTSSSTSVASQLSLEAKVFINNVELIVKDTITLEHKTKIDGAYFMYDNLIEEEKLLPEVIEAKAKLDKAKEDFLVLYEDLLSLKEAEETGYAFKERVDALGDVDSLVREDKEEIDELLNDYDKLSDRAKTLNVVIEAKTKLDNLSTRVNELVAMSDEEYEAFLFVAMVNKLPAIEDLTIYDIEKVQEVSNMYNALPNTTKELDIVKEAKLKLDGINQRIDELIIIKEHTDAFIELVYSLPSFGELKWNDANQEAKISQAEAAYEALTEEEKQVSGVQIAYNELKSIREAFSNLKQPYDILKLGWSIQLNGFNNATNNYNSKFSYTTGKDHITVLSSEYGIAKEEIKNHVKVYLNMYREAGAVKTDPLYRFDITENYEGYDINKFIEVLKQLKEEGNPKAVSGQGYNFTINIESISNLYASSEYSGFSVGQVINF